MNIYYLLFLCLHKELKLYFEIRYYLRMKMRCMTVTVKLIWKKCNEMKWNKKSIFFSLPNRAVFEFEFYHCITLFESHCLRLSVCLVVGFLLELIVFPVIVAWKVNYRITSSVQLSQTLFFTDYFVNMDDDGWVEDNAKI